MSLIFRKKKKKKLIKFAHLIVILIRYLLSLEDEIKLFFFFFSFQNFTSDDNRITADSCYVEMTLYRERERCKKNNTSSLREGQSKTKPIINVQLIFFFHF